jgi:hypothetical protein
VQHRGGTTTHSALHCIRQSTRATSVTCAVQSTTGLSSLLNPHIHLWARLTEWRDVRASRSARIARSSSVGFSLSTLHYLHSSTYVIVPVRPYGNERTPQQQPCAYASTLHQHTARHCVPSQGTYPHHTNTPHHHTRTYVHKHTCLHIYTYNYVPTHMNTQICACTHTHTHTKHTLPMYVWINTPLPSIIGW